ncbi:hypothetical protein YC2023_072871 [Brassica napus]
MDPINNLNNYWVLRASPLCLQNMVQKYDLGEVDFSLLIELLSHFHLPQTYLVQQATLFTKEFIIQVGYVMKKHSSSGLLVDLTK